MDFLMSNDFLNLLLLHAGATTSVYAPEPLDVGCFLHVDIVFNEDRATLSTTGPMAPGLVLFTHLQEFDL